MQDQGGASEMQSGDEAMQASDWSRDAVTTLEDVPWLLERAATGDSRFAAAREGFAGGLIACVVDSCTVPLASFFFNRRAVGLIRREFAACLGDLMLKRGQESSGHPFIVRCTKTLTNVARHVPQVCW